MHVHFTYNVMNLYSFIFIMIIVIKQLFQATVFSAKNNQHDNLDVENLCPIIFHKKTKIKDKSGSGSKNENNTKKSYHKSMAVCCQLLILNINSLWKNV